MKGSYSTVWSGRVRKCLHLPTDLTRIHPPFHVQLQTPIISSHQGGIASRHECRPGSNLRSNVRTLEADDLHAARTRAWEGLVGVRQHSAAFASGGTFQGPKVLSLTQIWESYFAPRNLPGEGLVRAQVLFASSPALGASFLPV